jgi:hypothetical protein
MSKGVSPDFKIEGNPSKDNFDYIHYEVCGKQFYFISNQTEQTQKANCTFRIAGRAPELWDALTGEKTIAKAFAQHDGVTTMPLTFDPYGSIMVCFNQPISTTAQGESSQKLPRAETTDDDRRCLDGTFRSEMGRSGNGDFPIAQRLVAEH